MILKCLLMVCLTVLLQAQPSHRDLTAELLKDLRQAVSDTIQIDEHLITLKFTGNTFADSYLNEIETSLREAGKDHIALSIQDVKVQLIEYAMQLNHISKDSLRNTAYNRQLDMKVLFGEGPDEYEWKSRISDNLSMAQLGKLLDEQFPGTITGDFLDRTPSVLTILLTTLGVFTILAALFFIRT